MDERSAELTVHDVLERGVQHHLTVELDPQRAGLSDIPGVAEEAPGGPDRLELAGPGVLGDHTAPVDQIQAGVGAEEAVVVATGPVEAGELPGIDPGGQLR